MVLNSGRIESQILTENKKPSGEGTGNAEQLNQCKKMFTLRSGHETVKCRHIRFSGIITDFFIFTHQRKGSQTNFIIFSQIAEELVKTATDLGEDDEIHLSAFSLVRESKKVRYDSGKSDMATFYSFLPAA